MIVVDPFHVIKHLSEAFSRIRLNLLHQDSEAHYLLKKWHFLLESDVHLDNTPQYNHQSKRKLNYRDLYEMLLAIDINLAHAYRLKELYRRFNREDIFSISANLLDLPLSDFLNADIPEFRPFLQLLQRWRLQIINSFLRLNDNRKLSMLYLNRLTDKSESI